MEQNAHRGRFAVSKWAFCPRLNSTATLIHINFLICFSHILIKLINECIKIIYWYTLRKLAHAINRIFLSLKIEHFQLKKFDIFLIFAQNIDCGYTLEPPRRGDSNVYPQSMFSVILFGCMLPNLKGH